MKFRVYILFLAFLGFILAYVMIKPLIIQKIFKNHPKLIEICERIHFIKYYITPNFFVKIIKK